MSRPAEAAPALIYKDGDDIILDGEEFDPAPAVQTVYSAPFEIAHAAIITLPTLAVTLVAAQGANKLILPESIVIRHKWTADYADIDAQAQLQFKFGSADACIPIREEVSSGVSALLAGGGPDGSIGWSQRILSGSVTAAPGAITLRGSSGYYDSDLFNIPLKLLVDNGGTGNFTGGNAANKLHGWVNYSVYDFTYFD